MTKYLLSGILFLILLSTGCKSEIEEKELLKIDHILVWVKDPSKMKSKIEGNSRKIFLLFEWLLRINICK